MQLEKKNYDTQILEILSKLYGRKSIEEILDVLSKVIREKERLNNVRISVENGENFIDALREQQLISRGLYEYLRPASESKNFKTFVEEYLRIRKEMKQISRKLITQAISPSIATIISLGVLYVFIYKLIPTFNWDESKLAVSPPYFPFLIWLSQRPVVYFAFILSLFVLVIIIYIYRVKFFSNVYGLYERLKLYVHLLLSITSGQKIDEAIMKFRGSAIDKKNFELLLVSGESLETAILQSLTSKPLPVEEVLIVSSFTGKSTEIEKNMKEFVDDIKSIFLTRVDAFGQVLNTFAMLIVGFSILFGYAGILIPLIKIVKAGS